MATKSLRCSVEIDIRAVTSPGTWLPKRDDVFVSVTLFGQVRQTRLAGSVFPLLFHDKLKFDKVFYSAYEPSQIADKLLDEHIRIELLQLSDLFVDGRILAWYESSAKTFLFPSPYFTFTFGLNGREIIMERSVSFPGISPRMEFSTKTVIQEASVLNDPVDFLSNRNRQMEEYWPNDATTRRNRSRSISPSKSYGRSTLSSALKAKTTKIEDVSDEVNFNNDDVLASSKSLQDRPPFVVRKIDDDLIGRKPVPLYPRIRSRSVEKRAERSQSLSPTKRFDRSITFLDVDSENQRLENDYRSSQPYLNTYDDYAARMDLIRARIDRAIRRNRSLERLEMLEKYRSAYRWPYNYYYLDDLELEYELARQRRRMLYL